MTTETTTHEKPRQGFLRRRLEGWLLRHQLASNFWLHMLGIPLALAGLVAFFFVEWYWAVGLLVVGYFLQWLGHCLEGNDVGEVAAIKRWLGLPYIGIAPRWNPEDPNRL